MNRTRTILKLAGAAGAGLCLYLLFRRLDFSVVARYPHGFWVRSAVTLALFQIAIILLHSVQWGILLREYGVHRGAARIIGARFAGAAVSFLSPALSVGGEMVRAELLRSDSTDRRTVYATVALDKYVELSTRFPLVMAGLGLVTVRLCAFSWVLVGTGGAFFTVLAAFTVLLLASRRNGGISRNSRLVDRLRLPIARNLNRHGTAFFRSLSTVRLRVLALSGGVGTLAACAEAFQIHLLLGPLGVPEAGPGVPLIVLAVSVLGGIVSFLPANVGTMEAANVLAFTVLGATATTAVAYSLLFRSAQLVIICLGFFALRPWSSTSRYQVGSRTEKQHPQHPRKRC